MIENMFRETKVDEGMTDIVAKILFLMAISGAVLMIAFAVWTILFRAPGNV
jgi:hypothetical protein